MVQAEQRICPSGAYLIDICGEPGIVTPVADTVIKNLLLSSRNSRFDKVTENHSYVISHQKD